MSTKVHKFQKREKLYPETHSMPKPIKKIENVYSLRVAKVLVIVTFIVNKYDFKINMT